MKIKVNPFNVLGYGDLLSSWRITPDFREKDKTQSLLFNPLYIHGMLCIVYQVFIEEC